MSQEKDKELTEEELEKASGGHLQPSVNPAVPVRGGEDDDDDGPTQAGSEGTAQH